MPLSRSLRWIGAACLLFAAPVAAQDDEEELGGGEEIPDEIEETVEEPLPVELGADALTSVDQTAWDALLAIYVSPDGRFDYQTFLSSPDAGTELGAYLDQLAQVNARALDTNEQLAFWINAYNACMVSQVIAYYPIDTVQGIDGLFEQAHCHAGGHVVSLNELENRLIRRVFHEPRVHFALNCAALGCPPLRQEAYLGATLESQLEDQTRAYVQATTEIRTNAMEVHLSRLFEWFSHDFDAAGGVREFVASRLEEPEDATFVRRDNVMMVYLPWDWALNCP